MSTGGFLAYDKDSVVARPLTELPMLRLADQARDVRGWEIYSQDGRPLGTVVDLLVDIDRLTADELLVSPAGSDDAGAMLVVPLHGLSPDRGSPRRMVPGEGMPPIAIQYQSTTRYALWGAIVAAIIALAGWMLGFFE
jgi:sporulation protein YlmC with PRC-barrel domain